MSPARVPDSFFLANGPADMRIFKGQYFNFNRRLLMCLGLWPYESKFKMYLIRIIAHGILMLSTIPELIDIIVHTEDANRQMLSTICLLSLWVVILKMVGMILDEEKMKAMHKSIANNWQLIQDFSERDVLHQYSLRARNVAILYFALVVGVPAVIGFVIPLVPKILVEVMPLQNPRPNIYLTEGEFFVDKDLYFWLFFFFNHIIITFVVFVSATFEAMYIASVEHCCALYAIVRYRLLMLRRSVQKSSSATEDGNSYEFLIQAIELHQHAQSFTSSLKDSYSMTFLFLFTVGLVVFPLGCSATLSLRHSPCLFIPYAIFTIVVLVQGFIVFSRGQRIINHQLGVFDAAYINEWYETPLRTRKLLVTFMPFGSQPTTITAGGWLQMDFEIFFKILKKAFSFTAVASSLR